MSLGQGLASKYYSGFNPLIYGGCALWVDAGDTTTLTLSGSNITAVRDKSPQSNAITVSSTQPTYVSNRQNGLGGIFMNGASWLINTTMSYPLANRTVFIVAEQTASSTTSFEGIIVFGGSSTVLDYNSSNAIVYTGRGSNAGQNISFSVYGRSGDYVLNSGVSTTPMPFRVYSESFAYPNGTLFVDACQTVTDTAALAVGTATGWVIGGRFDNNNATPRVPLYGYIYEILVYSNTLPAIDRQAVESYLMRKWGRIANIPTTHPYSTILPVTRSFLPLDISGCALWLDAADPTTVTLSGSNVTNVRDKSSNAYLLSNGTGFTYPNNSFNGTSNPSFLCTGSLSNVLGINTSFSASQPLVTFIVGQPTFGSNTGTFPYLMDSTNSSSRIALYYWSSNGYRTRMYAGGEIEYTGTSSGAFLHSYVANTTASAIFTDGTSRVTGSIGTGTLSGIKIGNTVTPSSSTAWVGHICEVLIYNGSLTTFQRQQVEGYLARKWGLIGSAPSLTVFSPLQISNCALWLDAADSSTLTLSGSNVTAWADKSGNGRNTSAVTGTPVLSNNSVNSKQGVYFGGTSYFTGPLSYSSNTLSWFAVATVETGGDLYGRVLSFSAPGQFDYNSTLRLNAIGRENGTTELVSYRNAYIGRAMNITYSTPFMVSSVLDGTSNYPFMNGSAATGAASTGSFGFSNYGISSSTGANIERSKGYIFEVLIYTGALTSTQRQQIEGYLAMKWGTQSSLPSTHPYAIRGLPAAHPMRTILPGTVSFNPRQIEGCALWLDAADPASFTFSSGSNISQWRDKASNGFVGTASNSPTLVYNSLNGYTSVNFNGTNQYIDFGNIINMGTSQIYIFVVSQYNSSANGSLIAKSSLRGFAGRWAMARESAGGGMYMLVDGNGSGVVAAFADTDTSVRILNGYWDRSAAYITSNGTQRATTAHAVSTNQSNTDRLFVGAYGNATGTAPTSGFYFNGKIGEIIVYLGTLNLAQRRQVEGYLAWKWGIQGPPSSLTTTTTVTDPTQISGCRLWLDAADSSTISFSSGSNISQWRDKSGNNQHAIQNVSGRYPVYSNSAVNGLSVVQMSSGGTTLFVSNFNVTLPVTVIMVTKKTSTGGFNAVVIEMGSDLNSNPGFVITPINWDFFGERSSSAYQQFYDSASGRSVASYNAVGTTYMYAANLTPALRINGSAISTAYSVNTGSPTGSLTAQLNIGSRNQTSLYGDVQYCEILVYNGNLSTTDLQTIEGYLALKWGLLSSLPSDHPYAIKGLPSTHPYKKISPI